MCLNLQRFALCPGGRCGRWPRSRARARPRVDQLQNSQYESQFMGSPSHAGSAGSQQALPSFGPASQPHAPLKHDHCVSHVWLLLPELPVPELPSLPVPELPVPELPVPELPELPVLSSSSSPPSPVSSPQPTPSEAVPRPRSTRRAHL